jgi:hypothetical protein
MDSPSMPQDNSNLVESRSFSNLAFFSSLSVVSVLQRRNILFFQQAFSGNAA